MCVAVLRGGVWWASSTRHIREVSLYLAVACVFKTGCNFLFLHILLIINLLMSSFASFSSFPSPSLHIAHLFDTCAEISESKIYKYIWKKIKPKHYRQCYSQEGCITLCAMICDSLCFTTGRTLLKRKICLYHNVFNWDIRPVCGGLVFDIVRELEIIKQGVIFWEFRWAFAVGSNAAHWNDVSGPEFCSSASL